jgi:hypothetical protein
VWKFGLQPFNFKFLEAGFISALVITGFYFLPFQGMPYIEAPVKGGAICLVLTVIFCRRRYSPEFNHLVNSALAIIRRK